MKRNTLLSIGLAGALAFSGLMSTSTDAVADVESNDPIKLTIHDWTGQYVSTHLMGEVLKKAGQ